LLRLTLSNTHTRSKITLRFLCCFPDI
jgi:hypothetical protein